MKILISLGILCLAARSEAALTCSIKTNMYASNYELSADARNGIRTRTGTKPNTSNLQGLECKCPSDTGETFVDNEMILAWDADSNLADKWKNSDILKISNCKILVMTMNNGAQTVSGMLAGAALIIDQVNDLQLQAFQVGNVQEDLNTVDPPPQSFSSIYIKNSKLGQSVSMNFNDRNEVLFKNITVDGDSITIISENRRNTINPIFRLEDSAFIETPKTTQDQTSGLGTQATAQLLNLNVKNMQRVVDTSQSSNGNQGCPFDYKGSVIVSYNRFKELRSGAINVEGAERVAVEKNYITVTNANLFDIKEAKTMLIRNNGMPAVMNYPIAKITYNKKTVSNCQNPVADDLPIADIETINFSGNLVTDPYKKIVEFAVDTNYNQAEFEKKLSIVNNSASGLCECGQTQISDNTQNTDISASLSKKANDDIGATSQCFTDEKGELLQGLRSDICAKRYPLTAMEREDNARMKTKKAWRTYLAIAVIVTFIITAILTFLLAKFCCFSNGGVEVE